MEFLNKNRFLVFLLLLLAQIIVLPFITHLFWRDFFSALIYSLILTAGMYAFSTERNFLRFSTVFFLAAISIEWIKLFTPASSLSATAQPFMTSVVLILLLIMTLRQISLKHSVDRNVIYGALSGYVLMGYIGALLAVGISLSYPDAYNTDLSMPLESVYFSFVTMTTLGYGEIQPLIPQSRALSILLSIFGPIYVATLLALIVSKYSSGSGK